MDPAKLVFLDESGVDTAMTPTYARAPRGQRALGRVPGGHWKRLTILGALAADGLVAAMTVAAATTTQVLLAFVQQVLLPALRARPGSIVVMDNLAPHKAVCVREALDAAGIGCRYLPPYSLTSTRSSPPGPSSRHPCGGPKPAASTSSTPKCPALLALSPAAMHRGGSATPDIAHLNPIEPAWSKLKAPLRRAEARSLDQLDAEMPRALGTITSSDAQGCFRYAGYRSH